MKHFQWKEYFRAMIAQIASALEILIAFLVLVAIGAAGIRLVQDVFFFAADTTGTQTFQQVLEQAFNLVIGIELIKMFAKHTSGSAIEVLLFAMARQLVIGHMTPVENLLGVIAIGIIFIIRKFLFVPSFGAHLPANAPGAKNIPSDTIE